MDLPSPHQASRGPMTRARARALETEVTSLLSDISYDPLETWLLPKSDILCMIRCQEEPPKDAREDGQATHSADEENQLKRTRSPSRPRTSGPGPGHPAPGASPSATAKSAKSPGPRHPASSPDIRPQPENPAKAPEIRRLTPGTTEVQPSSPDIRRPGPDIRPLRKPRTSGPTPGHPAPPVCAQ